MGMTFHSGFGYGIKLDRKAQKIVANYHAKKFQAATDDDPVRENIFFETNPKEMFLHDMLEELHRNLLEIVSVQGEYSDEHDIILFAKNTYHGGYGNGSYVVGENIKQPTILEAKLLEEYEYLTKNKPQWFGYLSAL